MSFSQLLLPYHLKPIKTYWKILIITINKFLKKFKKKKKKRNCAKNQKLFPSGNVLKNSNDYSSAIT